MHWKNQIARVGAAFGPCGQVGVAEALRWRPSVTHVEALQFHLVRSLDIISIVFDHFEAWRRLGKTRASFTRRSCASRRASGLLMQRPRREGGEDLETAAGGVRGKARGRLAAAAVVAAETEGRGQ